MGLPAVLHTVDFFAFPYHAVFFPRDTDDVFRIKIRRILVKPVFFPLQGIDLCFQAFDLCQDQLLILFKPQVFKQSQDAEYQADEGQDENKDPDGVIPGFSFSS